MYAETTGGISLPEPSRAQRKPALRSKGSFCGHLIVGDYPGRVVVFESDLERKVALILDADRNVAEIHEQAACNWRDRTGKERIHFFDFLVHQKDGRRIAIAVKHSKRLQSGRVLDELAEIAIHAVGKFCDEVRVVSERDINPIQFHNAQLFNAVRRPDPEVDSAVLDVMRDLSGRILIMDIVKATGMGPRAFRSIVRMIAKGPLQLSEEQPITPQARVLIMRKH